MTTTVPPLPLVQGAFPRRPSDRVPRVASLPPHTPSTPPASDPLDVAPFGEVRQPVPAPHPKPTLPQMDGPRAPETGRPAPKLRDLDAPRPEKEEAGYTDHDLSEALAPLVAGAGGSPTSLARDLDEFEAILRTTFRRALAQHGSGPFDEPGFLQRGLWRFDALFSSRSYEEVLYQKTRRFRVEEVFLLDRRQLSLISFASTDPARYASARKVATTAHRIGAHIRNHEERESYHFLGDRGLRVLVRTGTYAVLASVIRGEPDPLADADLAYALRRLETRFARDLEEGTPLLHELQPLLEECLLIQSPLAPLPE